MLELSINGKSGQKAKAQTISELLAELGYQESFVAVALNRNCVRRGEFAATTLQAGDAVEILSPMAGG